MGAILLNGYEINAVVILRKIVFLSPFFPQIYIGVHTLLSWVTGKVELRQVLQIVALFTSIKS